MSVTASSSLADLESSASLADQVAKAAHRGLASHPKFLPPWLFYDEEGSRLFDAITALDEYYLTRTERGILARHAEEILEKAAGGTRLRIQELGAGSADKTRLLLQAAVERQSSVIYEPIDVSSTALEDGRERIEREIPGVHVVPRVMDYTRGPSLQLDACFCERRLVMYIGSSIGNFEPEEAEQLLRRVRAGLAPGDGLLLGVDLAKDQETLLAAYDDAEGVTAAFNRNVLVRLNRELGADFVPERFAHRAVWNPMRSRIEMYLESRTSQRVSIPALQEEFQFEEGETIHTENSYKYEPGHAEKLLCASGFAPAGRWTDARHRFAVHLGRAK
jgi:L-histidine N-alpha-methyltransferase